MHWLSVAIALSLAVPIIVPLVRKRHACLWTVVWNFLIFVVMYGADLLAQNDLYRKVVDDLGFDTSLIGDPTQWYRALTAMYVHANPLHVLMNMLILTLMGVPFEDRVGTHRFFGIYLISGIIGGLVDTGFALGAGTSHIGIGASGAIFGIMGAFAYLYPRDEIPMILGFIFLQRVPVVAAVLFMGLIESLYMLGVNDNIGHIVHVASLIAGVGIAAVLSHSRIGPVEARPGAVEEGAWAIAGDGAGKEGKSKDRKGRMVDLEALHGLVINEEMGGLFEKFVKEDLPEVRRAWFDEFVRKAKCPKCRQPLAHVHGKFRCGKCGFALSYIK